MKKYITTVLIIICSFINFITAQDVAVKKPSPQWWLNSSFADSVDEYLFHVEGQYSYTKMTGSIEGEIQSGSIRTAVRKIVFTNHLDYYIR